MTSAILVSPLLYIPGFCIFKVMFDVMHDMDLGVLQHAEASTMWELTEDSSVFAGDDRQANWK